MADVDIADVTVGTADSGDDLLGVARPANVARLFSVASIIALAQTFSNPIEAPDGSITDPAFTFTSDPDTGMYQAGDNELGLGVAGDTALIISKNVNFPALNFNGHTLLTRSGAGWIIVNGTDVNNADGELGVDGSFKFRYQAWHGSNPSTIIQNETIYSRAGGTPLAGYGVGRATFLRTTTDDAVHAGQLNTYWQSPTHASRTSRWRVQTVYNGEAIGDTIGAGRTGVAGSTGLWLFDEDNGQMEQVLVGAADSGGSGFKVLRIAN